ncbi:MAG: hypothetical protein CM15mP73_1700 [Hyphomicrobiales bacterium]|nr:MAG: hypothetical protein CM15mP73_1700 [Hyphomicrobiales bacterium]
MFFVIWDTWTDLLYTFPLLINFFIFIYGSKPSSILDFLKISKFFFHCLKKYVNFLGKRYYKTSFKKTQTSNQESKGVFFPPVMQLESFILNLFVAAKTLFDIFLRWMDDQNRIYNSLIVILQSFTHRKPPTPKCQSWFSYSRSGVL